MFESLTRTRTLPTRLPLDAPLQKIVDWSSVPSNGDAKPYSAAALLEAWRKDPGYTYLFDRSSLDHLVEQIPEGDKNAGKQCLDFFNAALRHIDEGRPNAESPKGRVPIKNGALLWDCFTERNREHVCAVNRFHYYPGTAAATRLSGKRDDAETIFRVMEDWLDRCPVPEDLIAEKRGIWPFWYKPWAPLNTGLRAMNWLMAIHMLWDSEALTAERFGRFNVAIRQHMIYLGRVSPRIDRKGLGNHLVMEMESLLHTGLFPWLKESAKAREIALHNLALCIKRQILPDGVHSECAPGYHRGVMKWFSAPILLARLNKWKLPARLANRVSKMLDFGLHVVNPDGQCTRMADAGGGTDGYASEQLVARVFNRPLPLKAPKPHGIVALLQNGTELPVASGRRFPLAKHFPHGGFSAARTSWSREASSVLMKLDSYGGGHSHADFQSFTYCTRGRLIIDERGTRAYDNDRESISIKYAPAHNVVLLGDRDMLSPHPSVREQNDHYFGRRTPCVRVKPSPGKAQANGYMQTAARVIWPDRAWWERELVFDPKKGGMTIRDRVNNPLSEPVRIQFYIKSESVGRESKTRFSTRDPDMPNIRVTIEGSPTPALHIRKSTIYLGFFREEKVRLVSFDIPACQKGEWCTRIEDV